MEAGASQGGLGKISFKIDQLVVSSQNRRVAMGKLVFYDFRVDDSLVDETLIVASKAAL